MTDHIYTLCKQYILINIEFLFIVHILLHIYMYHIFTPYNILITFTLKMEW